MIIVCCGTNKTEIEFLCNNSFCKILEKRRDIKNIIYYLMKIDLDRYLNWINKILSKEITIFTTPNTWVNRKKVTLTIKYKNSYLHFFEINFQDLKNKIKSDFII